ncbi:uncharacterized protein [Drosophila kikkawai]|uniref:Uncharacterized protein isoform X2 n=1 Tax=Drosophila kikkawai TaxID=30033 RepID=A0ABM4GGA2_DROKI
MDPRRRDHLRAKFSRRVYFAFVIFLAIGLLQWVLISILPAAREIFKDFGKWCSIAFCLAALLFGVFIFRSNIRSHDIGKWVIAAAIVELYVFSMYVLAARTWLPDLLVYFFICILAMVVALVIGCNLSYSMDMTENIAPIFIATYILVSTSLYPLLLHLFVVNAAPYGFAAFDIILTVVMLLLAMLHAQTIRGDRFIKMSTDDCLLAALLLFHEFLAIYAMTFFWQINYHFFTPKDFFWRSTSTSTASMSTTRKHHGGGPPVGFWPVYDYGYDYEYGKTPTPRF